MLIYLILFLSCINPLDFASIFGEDYQKAVIFCTKNKVKINEKANEYGLPANQLTAIIFPELIRYSTFQNFFET